MFIYSFHAMFYRISWWNSWWNASTVFRPRVDFRNPTSPWIVSGPCCINARSKPTLQPLRGSPWRWRWRKARSPHNDTRWSAKLWKIWIIFVELLTQRCCDSSLHFCDDSWLTPLKWKILPLITVHLMGKHRFTKERKTMIGQRSSQCFFVDYYVDAFQKSALEISSFNELSGKLGPQVAVVQRSFYVGMAPCCCRVLRMPGFTMQQLQVKRLVGVRWHDILTGGV